MHYYNLSKKLHYNESLFCEGLLRYNRESALQNAELVLLHVAKRELVIETSVCEAVEEAQALLHASSRAPARSRIADRKDRNNL